MAIPSRQIGWSTRSNLLWQISKQLERLICVAACGCGTTTTTTTVAPTTSTTTTSETNLFEDLVYRAENNFNACTKVEGGEIYAIGDGTTFCNSTILTAPGFSALAPGELFVSYDGQIRTTTHGAGQNFITFTTECTYCR